MRNPSSGGDLMSVRVGLVLAASLVATPVVSLGQGIHGTVTDQATGRPWAEDRGM